MQTTYSVSSLLYQHAVRMPDAPALIAQGTELSYAELLLRVRRTASYLAHRGIEPAARVALAVQTSVPAIIAVLALLERGAVPVPLNTRLTSGELIRQMKKISCSHLICTPNFDCVHAGVPVFMLDEEMLSGTQPLPDEEAPRLTAAETAVILYTSGSSAKPKAVPLTSGNFYFNAVSSAVRLGLHRNDSWLLSLPIYHVGGFAILTRSLLYGIPVVIPEGFSTEALTEAMKWSRPRLASFVSTILRRMLEKDLTPPERLRGVLVGGGPLDSGLMNTAREKGWPVLATYGSTETCSQVATALPRNHNGDGIGPALMFAEIKICGPEGAPVKAGNPGEIAVRGPMVTSGYVGDIELNSRVFRDGWYHTGDYGSLDQRGYLRVESRRTDLIISGGENISPAEVEAVLRSHSHVADACVIGEVDREWGQRTVALVVTNASVSSSDGIRLLEDQLKSYVREHLAGFKIPHSIRFVDRLPYNEETGKINRAAALTAITGRSDDE